MVVWWKTGWLWLCFGDVVSKSSWFTGRAQGWDAEEQGSIPGSGHQVQVYCGCGVHEYVSHLYGHFVEREKTENFIQSCGEWLCAVGTEWGIGGPVMVGFGKRVEEEGPGSAGWVVGLRGLGEVRFRVWGESVMSRVQMRLCLGEKMVKEVRVGLRWLSLGRWIQVTGLRRVEGGWV